jgi:S-adenosylmethionine-dependent methyltransferase
MNRVQSYYDQTVQDEWTRLDVHRTEFAVTMLALSDFLPPPPASILDIGGGPGRYTIALARRGYDVTLLDLSEGNLAFAREQAEESGVAVSAFIHANVLALPDLPAPSYDAVLLLGPLYHLLTEEERLQAVQQALRPLRPGGPLFAAFITRFAQFRYAAKHDPTWLPRDREYIEQLLATGVHVVPGLFTDAYFAHPDEIVPLMESAGLCTLKLVGCEGAVSRIEEQINRLYGDEGEFWAQMNYRLGQEPTMYGASDHLLYVGQKPATGEENNP